MELIDIRWCLASCIRKAQRNMEITGKQSLGGASTKLGFDKSKVTCFKCKQKGHFKRECTNSTVDGNEHPFNDDYYRKAIYHQSREEPKMIEDKPKSRACFVIQDDEGFDWSEICPEEDRLENVRKTAHGRAMTEKRQFVLVAEIKEENKEEKGTVETKEKTREEILSEKTYRERNIALNRMDEMQKEYESAVVNKRWDKKRECYFNREGEPVVPKKDIILEDVLVIIPSSAEYDRNMLKDDTYAKRHEKEIKYAMTSCLRKRDEKRRKKNVEEMVNNLKKTAEEVKAEAVEVEVVKEIKEVKVENVKVEEKAAEKVVLNRDIEKVVTEEQRIIEDEKKIESLAEVKNENLEVGDAGDEVSVEEKQNDADQKQTATTTSTKVPITEVNSNSETQIKIVEQCKKCMETCRACTEKDEKFRTRDLEFTKMENIFKEKCKEMLEKEKVLKENDEKLSEKCKKLEKDNEVLKENVSKMTKECSQKENVCLEMRKEYDSMKLAYHITKESYEKVKGEMKFVQSRLNYCSETSKELKQMYEIKQGVVNSYIQDVAKLKRQIADLEQDNNKLKSYHASSYVLERIFNIKPDGKDSEQNKKGIDSEFHQVPPPEKFVFYDEEKVEKAFNMADQLPDNIDVTYSKSDDSSDSEVVGKVVESVLKEESVDAGNSESQDENEGNFHDGYLKNTKSEKKLNDDSKGLVYTMIGSDKLFLDVVFPIQNVISEKIDKVFKMVEIEKSEISKFVGKGHKTFYNKPGFKKKNMKACLGYKKKQKWKKNEVPNYQTKMSFVQGKSLAEEKELKFGRQSNEEFLARKKRQQPQVKDVSKRTCFKCDQLDILHASVQIRNLLMLIRKRNLEMLRNRNLRM
ncbi:putative transcription factor interactor and regulator CCHC(Zn) family [Helianthus debilis subsp. tardiflorus]